MCTTIVTRCLSLVARAYRPSRQSLLVARSSSHDLILGSDSVCTALVARRSSLVARRSSLEHRRLSHVSWYCVQARCVPLVSLVVRRLSLVASRIFLFLFVCCVHAQCAPPHHSPVIRTHLFSKIIVWPHLSADCQFAAYLIDSHHILPSLLVFGHHVCIGTSNIEQDLR